MSANESERTAAARLLAALTRSDDLTCETARELIAELVEAELAGVDVDADPAFRQLLQHLEQCPDCLELYERTAEALTLLDTPSPMPLPAMPRLFAPAQRSEHAVVRLLGGLYRRIELSFSLPALQPVSAGEIVSLRLFDAPIVDLPEAPTLTIALERRAASSVLTIALPNVYGRNWRARLTLDGVEYAADVQSTGIANITGFSEQQLRAARIIDLLIADPSDFERL